MKTSFFAIFMISVLLVACSTESDNGNRHTLGNDSVLADSGDNEIDDDGNNEALSTVFPMFVDDDDNGINDYVEEDTHYSGAFSRKSTESTNSMQIGEIGLYEHAFVDSTGDRICDYAQNGSKTWHGPGFVDEDNNGISDYWDESTPMHNQHEGIFFQDQNQNMINDYFEKSWHRDEIHEFVDEDGDGICDYAQDGSNTWHGPGLTDEDNNGVCDCWQPGGSGYGHGHGHTR